MIDFESKEQQDFENFMMRYKPEFRDFDKVGDFTYSNALTGIAYDSYLQGIKSQQAKIDELKKLRLLDEMEINQLAQANQAWQIKCDELQKKLDCCREENKAHLEKIDELQRKIAFQEKAIKNIKLQFENKQIDCDRSDRKIDELQARVEVMPQNTEAKPEYVPPPPLIKIGDSRGNKDEN